MKGLLILFIVGWIQGPSVTVTKLNGDQVVIAKSKVFQQEDRAAKEGIKYTYRGKVATIQMSEMKRMSLKESIRKKKGVSTFRAILVQKNNDKLEVEINLVRIEGVKPDGSAESINFTSVEKISF